MEKQRKSTGIVFLYMLIIFPFFSLTGLKNMFGTTFYQFWQVLSIAIMALILVLRSKAIKINLFTGLFSLYEIDILLITTLKHGFSFGVFVVTCAAIILVFLIQNDGKNITRAVAYISVIVAILNLITMLIPNDLENNMFFIGGKNELSMFLAPAFFVVILNSINKNGRLSKWNYIFIALCIGSIVLGGSGTGIVVGIAAIIVLILFAKITPDIKITLCVILFLNVLLLVFFSSLFTNDYWTNFTLLLGKDNSLTSRPTIWKLALAVIKSDWIFGSGRGTQLTYINIYGAINTVYEAHNFILEILFEGGVVALILYSIAFLRSIKFLNMEYEKHRVIFSAILIILLNGLTESTNNNFFVIIIVALANYYSLIDIGRSKRDG